MAPPVIRSEEDGVFNFFLVADANKVYVWDPVLNTKVSELLIDFVSIQSIAVDKKTKTVFVVDYNAKATGKKYSVYTNNVKIDSSNKTAPVLQYVKDSTTIVYQSDKIAGIVVDAKDNLLFISDAQINNIIKLNLTADPIDNKTGKVIPNPNKLLAVNKVAIKNVGPLSIDVPTQRVFYQADSNQAGGPAGIS